MVKKINKELTKRIICILMSALIFFSQDTILFAAENVSSSQIQESMSSSDWIDEDYRNTDSPEDEQSELMENDSEEEQSEMQNEPKEEQFEIQDKIEENPTDKKEDTDTSQIQKVPDSSASMNEETGNNEKQEQEQEQKQDVEDDAEQTKSDSTEADVEEQQTKSDSTEVDVEEKQTKEENPIEIQQEFDDPQFGRENGYIPEEISEASPFSVRAQYVHDSKFDNYTIHDVIDVSKYQGDVDWKKVKQSGIDYAMIRIGYRGYGEKGTINIDEKYENNIKNAISAGIKVGVYFFSQAITEAEAAAEADQVLKWIGENEISLPVTIDFEYASSENGSIGRLYNANLTKEAATNVCRAFCETIKVAGYSPMVYANKHMLENSLDASALAEKYEIWIANYNYVNSYEGGYTFWQYTQNGNVDGIAGNVDKNFWYVKPDVKYTEVSEGIYTISSCLNEDKVLDIASASQQSGVNVQLYKKNDTWAQKFYIRPEDEGTYVIMSANSGKVLSISDNTYNNETRICQTDYIGNENQQWRFRIHEDGSVSLESMVVGMVIDIKHASTQDGAQVQLYEYNGTNAQKFKLIEDRKQDIQKVKEGFYVIETSLANEKVVGVNSDSNGLEVRTSELSKSQKFKIKYCGGGCYQIVSLMNGMKVVSGEGTKMLQQGIEGNEAQQKWLIKPYADNSFSIISAKDGNNLDVHFASTEDGTIIQKYTGNDSKAQKFFFYEVSENNIDIGDGIYVLHSALSDKKVIDVQNASKNNGANIQLYTENGTRAQQFIIKHLDDGNYSIKSYNSEMAMALEGGKCSNGINVLQNFPENTNDQKWRIIPDVNGYYSIISVLANKALDVKYAQTTDGTNIQIYEYNRTKAQKFRLEKVAELDTSQKNRIEDGTYIICASANEEKVLDVENGSLYMGANVQLYTSNNTSAQQFVVQKDKSGELYTIKSKKSGLKVTYKDGVLKNDVNIYQSTGTGEIGNRWKIEHIAGDYYKLRAGNSNYCMDIRWGSMQDKTNIQLYEDNNSQAQIFKLKKMNNQTITEKKLDTELDEGVYTISSALNETMVLDVESASLQNGANIQLYKNNYSKAQKFILRKLENGNYTITSLVSGKMMSVENGIDADGVNVCQENGQELIHQQWKIVSSGNGYYTILTAQEGKAVDVKYAGTANGTNIQIYESNYSVAQRYRFKFIQGNESKAVAVDNNVVSYEALVSSKAGSIDGKYYLMKTDSLGETIEGMPITTVEKDFVISINVKDLDKIKLNELIMSKLVLAVKDSDGSYRMINKPIGISNPEAFATNTTAVYQGTSKKGLQGITFTSLSEYAGSNILDARNANTKHTLLNLDLSKVVSSTKKSGYIEYVYKGKTYYFSELTDLKNNVRSLNAGYKQYMNGNSGTTKVAVSLCLLLGYNSENSYLIDPAARTPGHPYYMLNVREEKARETFEALFLYLGDTFGQGHQYTDNSCYVSNWILGNEINSSKAWNYSGSLDFDTYMDCYATAFRLLYNGVKSTKTGNTVCISLDNGWTVAPDTYAGKIVLDTFAQKINQQNSNIKWSIAYHPYSYPLTRVDFWNDYSNTIDNLSTRYISMKNIMVLTNYAASLEKTYGLPTGSIRVLLTEQGYSYSGGDVAQATAIARGFYIAQFNDRIDAFIIRSVVDDDEEAAGKLYFGLMNRMSEKRISFYVYEYMDSDVDRFKTLSPVGLITDENFGKFSKSKEIVCNTNWSSIVPGYNKAKLASIK